MNCILAARTVAAAHMPVFLWDGLLLLTSLLLPRETVHGCEQGWFGKNCKLKCHCRPTVVCLSDGECPGGQPCDPRYFGPACQFEDLVYQRASPGTPVYVKDGDDTTCNPDQIATSVSVILNGSIPVSWFRIRTTSFEHLLKFTVKIDNASSCKKEKRFIQSWSEVDVMCSEPVLLTELRVEGDIAPTVCSIHISGDKLCSRGTFGLECQEHCTCDTTEHCHPATGVCAHICPSGRFGFDCSFNCSQNCYENMCSPDSGACYQCYSRTRGDYCDEGFQEKVTSSRSGLWMIVPVLFFLLMFIIGVYVCRKQRKHSRKTIDDESCGTTSYNL